MKRSLFITLATVMLSVVSGKSSIPYTIEGDIQGLPDNTVLLLTPLSHTAVTPVAETTVENGKFKFAGTLSEPLAVTFHIKDAYGSKIIILGDADMKITGNAQSQTSDRGTTYNFSEFDVVGSPLTDEYNIMMAPRLRLDSIMVANQNAGAEMMSLYYSARSENNQHLIDSIESTDKFKKYRETEEYCFRNFESVLQTTVEENKDNIWAPIAMLSQLSYIAPEMRGLYESINDSIKNTFHGLVVGEELYPVGRPGAKLPEFESVTIDGSPVSLSSLCKDKKYILLDFWASWCRPCRKEIPNLKQIYSEFADKGFDIVSISVDKDEQPWLNAVKKEELKWTNIRDTDESISGKYKVTAVPTIYIVDDKGCLVGENLHGPELAEKIRQLMTD